MELKRPCSQGGGGIPTGTFFPFGGDVEPAGWLFCDGQAVSRTEFADLFNVIGTKYGAGNGSTTFNVPNMLNRVAEGASAAGGYLEAGLPNIRGSLYIRTYSNGVQFIQPSTTGPFTNVGTMTDAGAADTIQYNSSDNKPYRILFDASTANSTYGNSDTVQMAATKCRYIIKT